MSIQKLKLYFLFLSVCLVACSKNESAEIDPIFINKLEAVNFTLRAPPDWELVSEQGIDTFIGRIQNNEDTIFFDQGFLSFKGLDDILELLRLFQ